MFEHVRKHVCICMDPRTRTYLLFYFRLLFLTMDPIVPKSGIRVVYRSHATILVSLDIESYF